MADFHLSGVSQADIESLGQKLEQFSQTLTPGERAALIEVLERARSRNEDVRGYAQMGAKKDSSREVLMLVRNALKAKM